jgi:hypothetical protein
MTELDAFKACLYLNQISTVKPPAHSFLFYVNSPTPIKKSGWGAGIRDVATDYTHLILIG